MNRLTNQLSIYLRENLLEEKWLVAPTLRVGNQWLEAAVRDGIPAANLHTKTVKSMALGLAAVDMARAEASLLSDRGGALLMDRIFRRLKAQGSEYLAHLEPGPRLSEALYASIQALRLAGLEPSSLRPSAFQVPTKGKELLWIFTCYLQELQDSHSIDYAEVLRIAMARLQKDPNALGKDLLILIPDGIVEPGKGLEWKLLESIPAPRRLRLPVDEPTDAETIQVKSDADLLRWVNRPREAPGPLKDGTVKIFRAVGESNEVREVLRECIEAGIPLDRVELLHTDAETYVPHVYEALTSHQASRSPEVEDLPVTFAEGIPSWYSRPGRALLGWLAWMREDYPQAGLTQMIREGLLNLPESGDGKGMSFSRAAAQFAAIGIGFGRGRYLVKLDEYLESLVRLREARGAGYREEGEGERGAASGLEGRVLQARALRSLVAALLEGIPESTAACQPAVLESAALFLEKQARCVSKLDNYSREKLLIEIREMQHLLETEGKSSDWNILDWLAELPGEMRILGTGPRPGCLHVAHALTGGHSGRPHTFLVGLDNSRFPGQEFQDPLVLDGERQRLSSELPTAADRLEQKLAGFCRLLARLRGKITFSFSCRDLQDDRELFPSPSLLAIYRLISGNHDGEPSDFMAWLPPPASFAPPRPEHCLNPAEWWLWRLCAAGSVRDPEALVARHFPHLERGRNAARTRLEPEFTSFDGNVPEAGGDLDPCSAEGPVMSARRLETLGICPLRYFFRYALEIEPPEELEVDPTRWLDPLAFGGLLHKVFQRFLGELIAKEQLPPEFARHHRRLQEILDGEVAACKSLYPPPNESAFQRHYRQLKLTSHIFLKEEELFCATHNARPVYLEASLGMPSAGLGTDLDTLEPIPLALPDGKNIRVRGRVDRIDQTGGGVMATYAIWDYKTGSTYGYEKSNPFQEGRVIQPYLYVSIVEHRLCKTLGSRAKVERFGFFFPGPKARGRRIDWDRAELSAGPAVVSRLCEIARSGAFLATTDHQRDCEYCDYRGICGDVESLAAASVEKLANLKNNLLKPILGLRPNVSSEPA